MIAQGNVKHVNLLKTGQTTEYGSGTGADDGFYEKGKAKAYTVLTTGQYSGTTSITINSKTDAHSNNVVVDNNTRLMWSRNVSASVGASSNGLIPWTTTGSGATAEGIFAYVAAANTASLSGHSDWRIPNIYELMSIADYEATNAVPDSTAFPSFPSASGVWTSTTSPSTTTIAHVIFFTNGSDPTGTKTTSSYCLLVRGGA